MKQGRAIATSAGLALALMSGLVRSEALPCPPPQVDVEGGGSATTPCLTTNTTYSTNFNTDENPLSEGGKWLHLDPTQTFIKVVGGHAFGTQTQQVGVYDDSSAYLSGFGTNYEVEGVVYRVPGSLGGSNREVEILLRWTEDNPLRSTSFGDTHVRGYEINMQHNGNYMELNRYKDRTLARPTGLPAPVSGDKFRARVEGQRIRVYWNDVLRIDYTDSDATNGITSGNPGIGLFLGWKSGPASNTDFGWDSVTIRALP